MSEPLADRVFPRSLPRVIARIGLLVLGLVAALGAGLLLVLHVLPLHWPGLSLSSALSVIAAIVIVGAALRFVIASIPPLLFQRLPVLVLDQEGLRHGARLEDRIDWPDIRSVTAVRRQSGRCIMVVPYDRSRFAGQLEWPFARAIPITLAFAESQPRDIASAIRVHPCYRGEDAVRL